MMTPCNSEVRVMLTPYIPAIKALMMKCARSAITDCPCIGHFSMIYCVWHGAYSRAKTAHQQTLAKECSCHGNNVIALSHKKEVVYLVSALSPISHRVSRMGWKQTSVHLLELYSAHKSLHTKFFQNYKLASRPISNKKFMHTHQTQNFQRSSPFDIAPVKKAHKARTCWYRWLLLITIPDFIFFKEWTETIQQIIKHQQMTVPYGSMVHIVDHTPTK